jgi:radical SAM superfamily enzyme YgiQ (UPF0313 family)
VKKLTLGFFNPPHADWCLANNMTWLFMQSYCENKNVVWLEAPYKFNSYESLEEPYEELKSADVILFSAYVWNYDLCDELARKFKERHPEKLLVLGGPHIGTKQPDFLRSR